VIFVAPNEVFFLLRTSNLRWKKGRGIYSPSQNVAVAASGGGELSAKVISGPIISPDFWLTPSLVLSHFSSKFLGVAYPARNEISGRIIRPDFWLTPSLVLSRFSSKILGGGLSGQE
jgi:hypothetical protein